MKNMGRNVFVVRNLLVKINNIYKQQFCNKKMHNKRENLSGQIYIVAYSNK